MPRALSRNARTLLVACLSGEEIQSSDAMIAARRELEREGLLREGSIQPTRAALRRRPRPARARLADYLAIARQSRRASSLTRKRTLVPGLARPEQALRPTRVARSMC